MKLNFNLNTAFGFGIALLVLQMTALCEAHAAKKYRLTDLGDLGGGYSDGVAINNAGQVIGSSFTQTTRHAFLYSDGAMFNLGSLVSDAESSMGEGINNAGEVIGVAHGLFLYSKGRMITIDQAMGYPTDINDTRQVTGVNEQQAFLYSDGIRTMLGTLGGRESSGFAINNSAQITGQSTLIFNDDTPIFHAFLYTDGKMLDLGTLHGGVESSFGRAINDVGQVTGYSGSHAFLYGGGSMRDLGTLGGSYSAGRGINSLGQVTGISSTNSGYFTERAFLYSDGVMVDLNTLLDPVTGAGWTLVEGQDINDSGQIVVNGFRKGIGQSGYNGCQDSATCHALLLTPIPEPSTFSLMVAGICLAGLLAHRRKR